MTRLTERPATELIALTITGVVMVVVVLLAIAVVVSKVIHPSSDVSGAAGQLGDTIASLIALLAGIAVGRSTNGHTTPPPGDDNRGG